jgi:nucleotide-binding universal stress UspA family protein
MDAAAPFTRILCGVEGDASSTEAARQAIALSTPGGSLRFVAVYTSFELGPDYTKEKLQEALEEATTLAREAGVEAEAEMREGRYAAKVLLAEAEDHDLLVIGTHGHSRVSGILLGSTASEAAHGTGRPLLIARQRGSEANGRPSSILLASDGSDGSWSPARVAGDLAAAVDAKLEVIHVDDGKHPGADEVLEAQLAEIGTATGEKPALLKVEGHATEMIVEAAEEHEASLIVCGRRGLTGIKSLGSVSERVVHKAGCSVLLIPGSADTGTEKGP